MRGEREKAEEEADDLQGEGDVEPHVPRRKFLIRGIAGRENDETQKGAESWGAEKQEEQVSFFNSCSTILNKGKKKRANRSSKINQVLKEVWSLMRG